MKHFWPLLAATALLPCATAQVSTGTGFAVAPGLLITNHHVIEGCTSIEIVNAEGRRKSAVMDADPLRDCEIQITAPAQPSNSGGPVMDGSGTVVGVVVAKLDSQGIRVQEASLPSGKHKLQLSVKDSLGRKGVRVPEFQIN